MPAVDEETGFNADNLKRYEPLPKPGVSNSNLFNGWILKKKDSKTCWRAAIEVTICFQ